MGHARENYQISERHACRLLGQWRGTQRYEPMYRADEDALTRAIIALASEYGRYGYRRITVELQQVGLAGRQRSGAAHLAAGRAESAAETEAARAIVAQRWVLCASTTGAGQPRLEL